MNLSDYREEIQLKLTGDMLELELDDDTINKVIKASLRELQRYITMTRLITIPYKSCIDLSNPDDTNGEYLNVNAIASIYRTDNLSGTRSSYSALNDPMVASQWQLLNGMGNLSYFQDAVYNYSAWTTLQQIRNTTSTDLAFKFDKATNKLYINVSSGTPNYITIEYIPVIEDVNEITSEYWIDMLMRLSLANTKVTLGRIRSRYTQSNALWSGDGDRILEEGMSELQNIQQMLVDNSDLYYPID